MIMFDVDHWRRNPATVRSRQLVSDVSEQITRLVRDEMRLAAVELQHKAARGIGGQCQADINTIKEGMHR